MKPSLFNTEMVRAILDGRKTVTRRAVKPQPKGRLVPEPDGSCWPRYFAEVGTPRVMAPPYCPGDILYVREAWCENENPNSPNFGGYEYRADYDAARDLIKWHPSIHMPKEAARLFLRVTDVRVERLQNITEEQAGAEGAKDPYDYQTPEWYEQHGRVNNYVLDTFAGLWDSTIKPADLPLYGWAANPWVWVIEFERISKEAALEGGRQ